MPRSPLQKKSLEQRALQAIDNKGVLLVFPILNAREPHSLWHELHPRSPLRWEWDESGDDRVVRLWALMKKLSQTQSVVYSKWYQSRATFFSRELFTATLCLFPSSRNERQRLSRQAQALLEILESDSPLSTKQLKQAADLQGKDNASVYNRALKELFLHQWIVGYGEVDDGAFPSLAVGATRWLHEDLWRSSQALSPTEALNIVDRFLPRVSKMRRFFNQLL